MKSRDIARALYKQKDTVENIDEFINDFISYMKKKELGHVLPGILRYLELMKKKEDKENTLRITFAKEPTKETVQMVQKYTETESDPQIIIDESVLGGFLAEYQGKSVDGTAATYIKNLKQELLSL